MKHVRFAALTATLALLLTSCDTLYGITRHASLKSLPDLACVEQAIASVPEVRNVRREDRSGGRPLTWTGIQAPDQLHYFFFEVETAKPSLFLKVDYAGNVELWQDLARINVRVPQEQVDWVRPVMKKIEKALIEHCGVAPFEIVEYCHGVKCKDE